MHCLPLPPLGAAAARAAREVMAIATNFILMLGIETCELLSWKALVLTMLFEFVDGAE